MRWQSVKSSIGYSMYALWNNGRKLLTLVFNSSSNAARIEYEGQKRVFLIRKEGFLKNKIVLRNEYGIRIGYAGTENNEDFIVLDHERYFYEIANSAEHQLTIYKESPDHPLAVCTLSVESRDLFIDLAGRNRLKDEAKYNLVMMLCWYLFQPAKVQPMEYSLT
jgi:hypothetical protein